MLASKLAWPKRLYLLFSRPSPSLAAVDFASRKTFETKHQLVHRLQEGISFGDGAQYNARDYLHVAAHRANDWKQRNYPNHDLLKRHLYTNSTADGRKLYTPENLEQDYWNIVEKRDKDNEYVAVEYGNDVDTTECGSGFPLSERGRSINGTCNKAKLNEPDPKFGTPDYYKETWWNLNNIANEPGSVLKHLKIGITGINVPWMYYGCLFSTFAWHNEDNYLYSINYHHKGAPKQWYGVPGSASAAAGVEEVFKKYLAMKMKSAPDLLHHITTMFSPRLLQMDNIPVYKALQHEGEFIVTFPRAFHGGFSLGPNIGEAVNFSTHDWISYGGEANERYRSIKRPAVFSHDRLTYTMANHLMDQKKYSACSLLAKELKRLVDEELDLRESLKAEGVRDVSHIISLPTNVVDQLDEASADYDDMRLCHTCRQVCFFSAVACECSQSRVSCLRHGEHLCRCIPAKRYFMFWAKDDELRKALKRVASKCVELKKPHDENLARHLQRLSQEKLPQVAVGVAKDLFIHQNEEVPVEPVTKESFWKICRCSDPEIRKVADEAFNVQMNLSLPTGSTSNDLIEKNTFSDEEDVTVIGVKKYY